MKNTDIGGVFDLPTQHTISVVHIRSMVVYANGPLVFIPVRSTQTQLGWGQYLWLKARACKGHALCAGVWQLQCIHQYAPS